MTKIGSFFLQFGILFVCSVALAKADIQVQATVDRNDIVVGETFTVSVTVKSNESVDFQDPRVPDMQGLQLTNQYSSNSVRTQFINGHMNHEIVKGFNYSFVASKAGAIRVDPFEVTVEGQTYSTQPILIKVSEGTPRQQPRQKQMRPQWPGMEDEDLDPLQQMEDEMFQQLLQRRGIQPPAQGLPGNNNGGSPIPNTRPGGAEPQVRTLPQNPNEAFFIQVEADKTQVYENEQVTVSWYLYTRGQMESLDRVKFPDLRGFWKEIIEEIPQLQFTEEIINGVVYRKALLASHALFPIKAGTAIIDEYKIKSRVRLPVQGFGFGFGRSYEYTKASQRVPIKVLPLPTDGRPSHFTGAVGRFDVHMKTESTNFPVNQPFSVKIRFEGTGNAKLIELPRIEWPTGLEVYDTKSESKFFKNGTSYKEFEVLVIPRQVGTLQIPGIQLSMFDPYSKKYETKSTEAARVQIVDNPNAPTQLSQRVASPGATPKDVKEEIPSLMMSADPSDTVQLAQSPFLWVGLYGTVFGLLLVKAQREFGWGRRKKTLKERLQPKFKKIDAAVKSNSFRQVGAEVTNTYYFILGELAGLGGGSQEIQKLINLMPASLRRDYADKVTQNFEIFQTLAFAPEEMLQNLKAPDKLKKNSEAAKSLILSLVNASSADDTQKLEKS